MAIKYSNEQQAVVVVDNILDNANMIYKTNCLVVQHFQYDCCRKLNQAGEIYGPMEPVILNFTVRVTSPAHSSMFYKFLASKYRASFSFLFNVNFGAFDRLEDYEDGLVVKGYVTSVKQKYSGAKNSDGMSSQMMLNVEVLVSSTVYMGTERSIVEEYIK